MTPYLETDTKTAETVEDRLNALEEKYAALQKKVRRLTSFSSFLFLWNVMQCSSIEETNSRTSHPTVITTGQDDGKKIQQQAIVSRTLRVDGLSQNKNTITASQDTVFSSGRNRPSPATP